MKQLLTLPLLILTMGISGQDTLYKVYYYQNMDGTGPVIETDDIYIRCNMNIKTIILIGDGPTVEFQYWKVTDYSRTNDEGRELLYNMYSRYEYATFPLAIRSRIKDENITWRGDCDYMWGIGTVNFQKAYWCKIIQEPFN